MLPTGFRPQKRKGQNFLCDRNILEKILESLDVSTGDIVLEIGSGQGNLTKHLCRRAKRVVAVEVDRKLFAHLQQVFSGVKNVDLINKNILKFNLAEFLKENKIKQKLVLVGNIPYSITTPIFEYIFENVALLKSAYLMVQREYAFRLMAEPGSKNYSSLSCFAQFHATLEILFPVKNTCFRPKPKVDSCFIMLEPAGTSQQNIRTLPKDKGLLFRIIQAAFNQRRKTILNSLAKILDKSEIADILHKLNIDARKRAENLSLEDYIKISNECFEYL